jgi:release factor glutamine methyltransferase
LTRFELAPETPIGDALRGASRFLLQAGVGSGNLDASLLLGKVTGLDRLHLLQHVGRALQDDERSAYLELVARRSTREPLQYILGTTEFMGLELEVTSDVLIPRGDTETLVEAVLDHEESLGPRAAALFADIGTGSGAISVALASYVKYFRGLAVDLSAGAARVARRNLARHALDERVTVIEGDGLVPLEGWAGQVDYLVSNPPYIASELADTLEPEVRDHEPHEALFPGEDALLWYRRFAGQGARLLRPGGVLAVEVGEGQAPDVEELLVAAGWTVLETRKDLGGIARVVVARRPAER